VKTLIFNGKAYESRMDSANLKSQIYSINIRILNTHKSPGTSHKCNDNNNLTAPRIGQLERFRNHMTSLQRARFQNAGREINKSHPAIEFP
jgi:hypothetical protein